MKIFVFLFLVIVLFSQDFSAHYLNISGFSYHIKRRTDDGKRFNELNYGVGYRYMYKESDSFRYNFDTGIYFDSGYFWTKYLLLNLQPRLYKDIFIALYSGLIQTKNLNNGNILFVSVPGLSWNLENYDLNILYLPKFNDMNKYDAIAFFLSLKL